MKIAAASVFSFPPVQRQDHHGRPATAEQGAMRLARSRRSLRVLFYPTKKDRPSRPTRPEFSKNGHFSHFVAPSSAVHLSKLQDNFRSPRTRPMTSAVPRARQRRSAEHRAPAPGSNLLSSSSARQRIPKNQFVGGAIQIGHAADTVSPLFTWRSATDWPTCLIKN